MAHEILENKKLKMVIFGTIDKKEKLHPLSKNRIPLTYTVAGRPIIDWIYKIAEEVGIDEIAILIDKIDSEPLKEILVNYMYPSEPILKYGSFYLYEFDNRKGITRDLTKKLFEEFLTEESVWLDGNVIFSQSFFDEFLRNTSGKMKYALISEEEQKSLGIGFFAKRFLEKNLLGVKNVDEIYQRLKSKVASAFLTMKYEKGKTEFWRINYLWNLLDANQILINEIKEKNEGTIEENVSIKGKVQIEEGARIRSGSYLEGPLVIGKNSDVGPNCYLRKGVVLEEEVRIGNACELKNTIVSKGTHIAHLSYVGDSIIGRNCNFGAGTITGNLRLDDQTIKAKITEEVVSTGRRKIGVIMGDNVKTAINTFFMPGVIIGNNSAIGTGVILNRNLPDNSFIYQEQALQTIEWIIKPKEKNSNR